MNRKARPWTLAAAAFAALILVAAVAAEAQTGVLFVKNNRVGVGIANPVTALHVVDASGTAAGRTLARLDNNGPPKLVYNDTGTGNAWEFSMQGVGVPARFVVNQIGSSGNELSIRPNGTVIFNGNGTEQFKSENNGNLTIKGTLTQSSSRTVKQDFVSLDAQQVLDRVAALPLTEWSYRSDLEQRHVGPMAEDFWAAFGLGSGPSFVSPSDTAGVALVAIQGLFELLQEKDQELAELRQRLAALESQ